jgi:hypothetical protein
VNIITLKQIENQQKSDANQENWGFSSLECFSMDKSNSLYLSGVSDRDKKEIEEIQRDYKAYIDDLKEQVVLLREYEDPSSAVALFPYSLSRYSKSGQKKIAKSLQARFPYAGDGVFLTLTFDPHQFSMLDAYKTVTKRLSKFLSMVRTYARREIGKQVGKSGIKAKTQIEYIWTIEVQTKKTGYPHVHVFFPALNHLLPQQLLEKLWGAGYVFVKYLQGVRIGEYMSKYLTKGQGLEWGLPFLWRFGIRLYGSSGGIQKVKRIKSGRYEYIGSCYYHSVGGSKGNIEALAVGNNIKVVRAFGSGKIIFTIEDGYINEETSNDYSLLVPF